MDRWSIPGQLQLDIVARIASRPNLWQRCNIRGIPTYGPAAKNESRLKLANGNVDILQTADDSLPISLQCQHIDRETTEILEEMSRRGVAVSVYPRTEGGALLNLPLINGMKGDPVNARNTDGALGSDTTAYLIESDASHGWYLREFDPAEDTFMAGIPNATEGGGSNHLYGRGIFCFKTIANLIKNALLAVSGVTPFNWTYTGTIGVNGGVTTDGSWLNDDIPSLWASDSTKNWQSDAFVTTPGHKMSIAFGYASDGDVDVAFDWQTGVTADTMVLTAQKGRGFYRGYITVPAGEASCRLKINLNSGNYAEFCAFQVEDGKTQTSYLALSSGTGTTGAVTGNHVYAQTRMQPHLYSNSFVCAAAIVQPAWSSDLVSVIGTMEQYILKLKNTTISKSIAMSIEDTGLGVKLHLREDGVALGSVAVTHARGKQYLAMLYAGQETGGAKYGCKLIDLDTGTEYSYEKTAGINEYKMFGQIDIGSCGSGGACGFDGIISGLTVSSISQGFIDDYVDYYSDLKQIDMFRRTLGRLYSLHLSLSPHRFEREYSSGTIKLEQIEAL